MTKIISLAEKRMERLQPIECYIQHNDIPSWYEVQKQLEGISFGHLEKEKRWEMEEFVSTFKLDLEMLEELGEKDVRFRFIFNEMEILIMQQALNGLADSSFKQLYTEVFNPKMKQRMIR